MWGVNIMFCLQFEVTTCQGWWGVDWLMSDDLPGSRVVDWLTWTTHDTLWHSLDSINRTNLARSIRILWYLFAVTLADHTNRSHYGRCTADSIFDPAERQQVSACLCSSSPAEQPGSGAADSLWQSSPRQPPPVPLHPETQTLHCRGAAQHVLYYEYACQSADEIEALEDTMRQLGVEPMPIYSWAEQHLQRLFLEPQILPKEMLSNQNCFL